MKKLSMLLLVVMILVFTVAKARADLTIIGTASYLESSYNLIYEDNGPFGPITWLDYTRDFDTWQNQVDWASGLGANLTVALNPGYTTTIDWTAGWRLPETLDAPWVDGITGGYNITTSEMGHLNYLSLLNGPLGDMSPFNNLHADDYWSGTEYSTNTNNAWGFFFGFGTGYQYVDRKDSVGTALAVHPGNVGEATGITEVEIDIRPQGDANRINLRSNGKIAVAIISTPDFDAPSQVDQSSLTFGATGDEQSLVSCKPKPKDINHDGVKDDLVCLFYVQLAGFQCDDTEGTLKGKTVDGISIEGKDSVNIVKCK